MQRPPDPPDPSVPERKYRSRARQQAAEDTARNDPSTDDSPRDGSRAEGEPSQINPEAKPEVPPPTPPQNQAVPPKLVRSGAASPVRRVDIVIRRPPPPKPPPSVPPQDTGDAPKGGTGTVRSRIQEEEKEFQLPKGFWSSLLIGVLCLAAVITLVVTVKGWVGDYRQQQEEQRRAEAERVDRANHPLYYRERIEQYAAENDLNPALVAAVILCESSFDPDALSGDGARGLMQIMPDTANWIAEMSGEPDFSLERLFEAELNIRMGTWYLRYLAKHYNGDVQEIICGYHAGQGNVDAWLSNPEYSSDGITLDVIPMADTAGYEDRVQRAILAYQKYHFAEDAQESAQEDAQ